jgi:hypothetical protein
MPDISMIQHDEQDDYLLRTLITCLYDGIVIIMAGGVCVLLNA